MRVKISELADAMVRHHGRQRALELATQYADDAAALGDHTARIRWSRVAATLADAIVLEQDYARLTRRG